MNFTDTQKKIAEQLLLTVINKESYVEYNELAERVDVPIQYNHVGKESDEVSKVCHKLGLPFLSAKAIRAGGNTASSNFFNLLSELGIKANGKSNSELFKEELQKIRECKEWYKLAEYYGLEMSFIVKNRERRMRS